MLTEEEQEKYLTIFKKCLTGKEGKNQISIDFPLEAERSGHMQTMLYTWTQGFETPTEVYQRIIQSYTWDGDQFVILLGSGICNLPAKASDGTVLEDSENVYRFTICCICPVDLAGEGLVYSKEDTSFKAMEKNGRSRHQSMVSFSHLSMTEDPTFILFYTIRKKNYMQNLSRMGWNVAFHYPRKISKNIFLLRSQKHSRIIIH